MQGKQEVIWPRLVASKILRGRLGSNNFIADSLDSTETLLERPNENQASDLSSKRHSTDQDTHKVFVSSWNVGGIAPPDDLNMEDWLDTYDNPADIYVLGFQEIVPLNAGNILGSENNEVSMKWNSLIREALNKTIPISKKIQDAKVGELQKVYPLKDRSSIKNSYFRCIISKQMVGIFMSVWVRSDLCHYIRHPSVSCVGCGIMGCLGNKGSVSVRFYLHETSFCFVCCHLASGGKEGNERRRNADAAEILTRTSFPRGPSRDLPHKILDHDQVIWLGDLNYRIDLPETTTRSLVERREWSILLESDQLKAELTEGHVFEGWDEGAVEFGPTYKYYPNSDAYYGSNQSIKSKKWRAPAWCDRIIWFGKGLKQNQYNRGESRLSDHRPVQAIFTAEIGVSRTSREYKSFQPDRFDHLTDHFASSFNDKHLCNGRSDIQI